MQIRAATLDDIPAMLTLANQLGYAVSPDELGARMAAYNGRADHVILVAEDDTVLGFINGGVRRDLVYEDMVELMSLVVDSNARNRGVGKQLLGAFEDWVRGQGVSVIKLGSRDVRKDAHRFYEREGYELEKLHHIYRKRL